MLYETGGKRLTNILHPQLGVLVPPILAKTAQRTDKSVGVYRMVDREENATAVVHLAARLARHCRIVEQVWRPPTTDTPRLVQPIRIHVLTKHELRSTTLLGPRLRRRRLRSDDTMEPSEIESESEVLAR